jgi:hypothetical protein
MTTTPQHHIIKETSETLSRLLQDEFKRNGYKRVHIVEQAPKPDAVEGKLPAVSVYLYQLSLDPEGSDATVHSEIVEVGQDDGTVKEYLRRRRMWVRLDYLASAWAQTPEDEQLLVGLHPPHRSSTTPRWHQGSSSRARQLRGRAWPARSSPACR